MESRDPSGSYAFPLDSVVEYQLEKRWASVMVSEPTHAHLGGHYRPSIEERC